MSKKLPGIENYNDSKAFLVDGVPYFGFAGEVHNSSCSNVDYFKKHVLEGIDQLHINTLIIPVYWEQIEPVEGAFQFDVLDGILEAIRERGLRVILLWFGLWKNGLSTYIPQWMKLDRERYPFARKADGHPIYSITPLCEEAVEKDSIAFTKLMGHLLKVDGDQQTVIAVQVENEVGTLETERDFGAEANRHFSEVIPQDLQSIAGKTGSWQECFLEEADEVFMCYYYAKAVNQIAKAGKEVYPLPMVVNAWLAGPDEKPGKYPSGGPVQKQISLWRELAPSIDLCVPDIYVDNFKEICDIYAEQGFLFIPEARQDVKSISNAIYAFAHYPCGCFAPFGIEDFLPHNTENLATGNIIQILNIEMEAFQPEGTLPFLSQIYRDLSSVNQLVLEKRSEGKVHAFMQEAKEEGGGVVVGSMLAQLMFISKEGTPHSAGFILELSENEWLIYGMQFLMMPKPLDDTLSYGVLSSEEGRFQEGEWICDRILNGDEQYVVSQSEIPKFRRLKWHVFK